MAKCYQAAITERVLLDLDADDGCGKRCVEPGAGGHEQVEPEMASAAGVVDEARDEHLAGIDGAFLAKRSDAEFDAMRATIVFPDRLGFIRLFASGFYRHRVGGVAIGDERCRIGGGGAFEQWLQRLAVRVDPGGNLAGTGCCLEAAGMPQDGGGETRIHPVELAQKRPGRPFADGEIGIVVGMGATGRRDRDRRDEAHGDEIEEQIDLFFRQRILRMEAAGDCRSGADRIGMVEPGIGGGDRHLCNHGRMQGVAEIDEAGNGVVIDFIDQDVPIVGVVVNDGGAEGCKPWRHGLFEADKEAFEQGTVFGRGDVVQPVGRAAGMADIPVEIA